MFIVKAKFRNKTQSIYEGRKDWKNIFMSIRLETPYGINDEYPYEVIAYDDEEEVFRGNFFEALEWARSKKEK